MCIRDWLLRMQQHVDDVRMYRIVTEDLDKNTLTDSAVCAYIQAELVCIIMYYTVQICSIDSTGKL